LRIGATVVLLYACGGHWQVSMNYSRNSSTAGLETKRFAERTSGRGEEEAEWKSRDHAEHWVIKSMINKPRR